MSKMEFTSEEHAIVLMALEYFAGIVDEPALLTESDLEMAKNLYLRFETEPS